ncbi:MAG: CrcB family protein [Pararhodobacter sp.]|nr:CrcB family protein [Pararhodobacter sp.]
MLMNLSLVALGGAAGSMLRYLSVIGAARLSGSGLPVGTMAVNVVGSFAIGILAIGLMGNCVWTYLLLVSGFLGGFTTFSAFSLEAFRLWETGQTTLAATYVAGSVILGIAALLAGLAVGRMIT